MFLVHARSLGARVCAVPPGRSKIARVTFLSRPMIRAVRMSGVSAVIYVPGQGASTLSFLRAAVLRLATGRRVIMIALQPSRRGTLERWLIRQLAPDLVLTPSLELLNEVTPLGVKAAFLPMGVDDERFAPVSDESAKRRLRKSYGVDEDAQVVLHVGHLNPKRNLRWLGRVRALTGATVLMVAGSAMAREECVAQQLEAMGVRLLDTYFDHIEELYQLADVYVFPVRDPEAAIAAPLSVLEAMACNLPVVATPFGALPRMFAEGNGLFFAHDEDRFAGLTRHALGLPREAIATRQLARGYSWRQVVGRVVDLVAGL